MGCALKISCLHKCKCCKQNLDLMLYLVPALRAIVLLAIYYKRVLVMLVHSSFLLLPKDILLAHTFLQDKKWNQISRTNDKTIHDISEQQVCLRAFEYICCFISA